MIDTLETYFHQYMERYCAGEAKTWCYEEGLIYKGLADLYTASGERWSYDKLIYLINQRIQPSGNITGYDIRKYRLDHLHSGHVLFFLYKSSGDLRYLIAMRKLRQQLQNHPRTTSESFWHKMIYPFQVWIEGLYMGPLLLAQYTLAFENGASLADVRRQFFNVRSLLFDPKIGLYYHGYDESRQCHWANSESGLSTNFWSHALGFLSMAFVDLCDILNQKHKDYVFYTGLLQEIAENILPWQQADGLWMQVMNLPEREGNFAETSSSAMFAYVFLKGQRLGILDPKFSRAAFKALEGILEHALIFRGDKRELLNISDTAGLGDGGFEYYVNKPVKTDAATGVGPLMMVYAELLRLKVHAKQTFFKEAV